MKHLILISMLLTGCATAHMIAVPGATNSQYAPKNEQVRPGMIEYQSSGLMAPEHRQSAYRKMWQACQGSYKIISEGPRDQDYWDIKFECDGEPSAEFISYQNAIPQEDFK